MPPITLMLKPASGLCNMRCSYCFYEDEMNNRSQFDFGIMTASTLEQIVKKALDFAEEECNFMFQGGEPTLAGLEFFQHFNQLEEQYKRPNVKITHSLQTNGYAIDEAWCRYFAEHNFLVGLSLDGIQATHDYCRKDKKGNGTYVKTLKAAELFNQFNVDYNILTVVNNKVAPRIKKIYEQYSKRGFRFQQYIACLDPLGATGASREYSLTPKQYGEFLVELFELWSRDLMKGEQPYIRTFENYFGILLGQEPESCEQRGVCSIQNVIEADGSVFPCDFYVLDDYKLGNLNQDSFETIYRKRNDIKFMEQSISHIETCKKCRWFRLCRGGCRRHREQTEEQNKNYFCDSYQYFFENCYENMVEIARRLQR